VFVSLDLGNFCDVVSFYFYFAIMLSSSQNLFRLQISNRDVPEWFVYLVLIPVVEKSVFADTDISGHTHIGRFPH
jgi:hypothetical protein